VGLWARLVGATPALSAFPFVRSDSKQHFDCPPLIRRAVGLRKLGRRELGPLPGLILS
jgi:hypothetical protein